MIVTITATGFSIILITTFITRFSCIGEERTFELKINLFKIGFFVLHII